MSAQDPKKKDLPKIEQAGASDENIQNVHAILVREKEEPAEGYTPMLLFVLGFISAVIFIVSIYFVHNRASFDPLAYDERYDASKVVASSGPVKVDPIVAGKKLYNTCATCHQATGTGVPGVYPPLAKSEWVLGSDERLVRILLHGLSGEVQVLGNTYNGAMPNFGPGGGYNWKDEQIAYVLTYIRQEWGNTAAEITPERVKEIRTGGAAGRAKPWTQAELLALP
jgi:mono/diheme cytochrome c family protein